MIHELVFPIAMALALALTFWGFLGLAAVIAEPAVVQPWRRELAPVVDIRRGRRTQKRVGRSQSYAHRPTFSPRARMRPRARRIS